MKLKIENKKLGIVINIEDINPEEDIILYPEDTDEEVINYDNDKIDYLVNKNSKRIDYFDKMFNNERNDVWKYKYILTTLMDIIDFNKNTKHKNILSLTEIKYLLDRALIIIRENESLSPTSKQHEDYRMLVNRIKTINDNLTIIENHLGKRYSENGTLADNFSNIRGAITTLVTTLDRFFNCSMFPLKKNPTSFH